jgi:hypothetical protein
MLRAVIAVTLFSVILPALPARANYLVSVKLTCYDGQGDKLAKVKRGNADIIGMCIGKPANDPSIANYAVTYDSDSRELHVLRRCDGAVTCDLSDVSRCETVGDVGITSKRACLYDLLDIGATDVHGGMLCTENETYSMKTHKYTYKETCAGSLATPSETCAISFKSGKGFDESGICE